MIRISVRLLRLDRCGGAALVALLVLALGAVARGQDGKTLRVRFLTVGQGDAALIRTPAGKSILVDAGPPESGASVREALVRAGVGTLDLAVISHPHLDHIGGMKTVFLGFRPLSVLDPSFPQPSRTYDTLKAYLAEQKVPVRVGRRGMVLSFDSGVRLEVVAPEMPFLSGTRSDANSNSIVFRLVYSRFTALFTGDSEAETEQRLLASGQALRAGVLKVAHHGSRYASGDAMLKAVGARVAVISCGVGNDYGHPHSESVARLWSAGAEIRRTDLEGTIVMASTGGEPTVDPEKPYPAAPIAARAASSTVTLRTGPATRFSVGATVPAGQWYVTDMTSSGWVRVRYDNRVGWAWASGLKKETKPLIRVTSGSLTVRGGAGTTFAAIGKAYVGQRYAKGGTSGSWTRIWFGGREGYVYTGSVAP